MLIRNQSVDQLIFKPICWSTYKENILMYKFYSLGNWIIVGELVSRLS